MKLVKHTPSSAVRVAFFIANQIPECFEGLGDSGASECDNPFLSICKTFITSLEVSGLR
jgi:hypothetical protein